MKDNEVQFDIIKIDINIKKDNIYEEGDNKFQFYKDFNPDNNSEADAQLDIPKYVAKINLNSFKYLGILSNNLKKELYGYNCYENGDEYFGEWNKDKKEGYGIYYYKENDGEEIKQIYIGDYKNNIKSGEGLYFNILKLGQEEDISIPIDYTMAIGNFSEDSFIKGAIFTIKDRSKKVYKGKISKEGKKNDDNGELYEDDNKVFHGIFKDNYISEGRIIIMKDGKKESGYYFKKKSDEDINFDYEKGEKDDDKYINKLNGLNYIFQNDKIKDLFINIIVIRFKLKSSNSFDYIKNLNFESDIKQKLKEQYGKFLHF